MSAEGILFLGSKFLWQPAISPMSLLKIKWNKPLLNPTISKIGCIPLIDKVDIKPPNSRKSSI